MTEHELIQGCIDKKPHCQKLLFDTYAGKMMSVCLRYANDDQWAKDILQEGFIKVFKYVGQFRFEGSFEGWMRRVFVSVAMRMQSKHKLNFSEIDFGNIRDEAVDPEIVSKLSEAEIHQMIRNLPDGYRTVFNLHVIEGYSHEEIANMLGIQAATSRVQLLKARKYLQAQILKKNSNYQALSA